MDKTHSRAKILTFGHCLWLNSDGFYLVGCQPVWDGGDLCSGVDNV
jgi:hypothetical protein